MNLAVFPVVVPVSVEGLTTAFALVAPQTPYPVA